MCKVIERKCPECGTAFETSKARGKPRTFCTDACKAIHANRRTARGKALVSIAQAWRKSRGAGEYGKWLFGEVTSQLDAWNAEDAEAGRMDPVEYAKLLTQYHPVNPDYNGGKTFEANRWFDRKNF